MIQQLTTDLMGLRESFNTYLEQLGGLQGADAEEVCAAVLLHSSGCGQWWSVLEAKPAHHVCVLQTLASTETVPPLASLSTSQVMAKALDAVDMLDRTMAKATEAQERRLLAPAVQSASTVAAAPQQVRPIPPPTTSSAAPNAPSEAADAAPAAAGKT